MTYCTYFLPLISTRIIAALCAIVSVFSMLMDTAEPELSVSSTGMLRVEGKDTCMSLMEWPLRGVNPAEDIVQPYDAPAQPWLSGHRGVDLRASPGTELIAPATGVISFAGTVGHKDVVVITHPQGWRSTFEPATTTLRRGQRVRRGEVFATRSYGESDHCTDVCVQWGVKVPSPSGSGRHPTYLNPQKLTRLKRIVVKRASL
ncbi:M23 family metallopeptidase [Alloscardovia macacae]|uniref:Peptidase, M23 family n=2 Tax=Alloscardovia macacae TaxID=1160091 RepID=A0A261F5I1_9BIFI|nr:peptidase, M23 family [Alloscardovia macacae]